MSQLGGLISLDNSLNTTSGDGRYILRTGDTMPAPAGTQNWYWYASGTTKYFNIVQNSGYVGTAYVGAFLTFDANSFSRWADGAYLNIGNGDDFRIHKDYATDTTFFENNPNAINYQVWDIDPYGSGATLSFKNGNIFMTKGNLEIANVSLTNTTGAILRLKDNTIGDKLEAYTNGTDSGATIKYSTSEFGAYTLSMGSNLVYIPGFGSITLGTYTLTFNQGALGGSLPDTVLTASTAGSGSNLQGSNLVYKTGGGTGNSTSSHYFWATGGGTSGTGDKAATLAATLGYNTLTFNNPTTTTILNFGTSAILNLTQGKFLLSGGSTSRAAFNIATQSAPTSPTSGDFWHDTTQKETITFSNGIRGGVVRCLHVSNKDTTQSNINTEKSLVTLGVGSLTLPANFFLNGNALRVRASGFYKTKAAAPGTLQIKLKKGSTVLLDTGAQNLTASMSNRIWEMEGIIAARSGTTVIENCSFRIHTSAIAEESWEMRNTGTVTISSSSEAIDLTVTFSVADVDNSITNTNFTLEVLTAKT